MAIPAQSVVATRSKSRSSCFARYAKNGSYAFFVSVGVGCSGPTPKRSLPFLSCPTVDETREAIRSAARAENRAGQVIARKREESPFVEAGMRCALIRAPSIRAIRRLRNTNEPKIPGRAIDVADGSLRFPSTQAVKCGPCVANPRRVPRSTSARLPHQSGEFPPKSSTPIGYGATSGVSRLAFFRDCRHDARQMQLLEQQFTDAC